MRFTRSTLSVVLVGVLSGTSALSHQKLPSQPDEPFDIYVFTDTPGDPDDKNSLAKTAEEVGKKIRDRKKWFRLVESRGEADVLVELVHQVEGRSERGHYVRRTENGEPSDGGLGAFVDIRKGFTLETKVHLPGALDPMDMSVVTEGRRPRDTAKPFARELEGFCRLNYWMLMEALQR